MKRSRGPAGRANLWAAVALRSGGLPPPAVVRTWLRKFAPKCTVAECERAPDEADAERTFRFEEYGAAVGCAHFPWGVAGRDARVFKSHATHAFLSLSVPGPGAVGRRALARAAASITATSDTAFVWWGRTGGIYRVADFLRRVEGR